MMKETSTPDVQLAPINTLKKRLAGGLLAALTLAAAGWFITPGFSSLYSSDYTISKQNLRLALVERGSRP
ncbi:MAG: hypothetical protein ACI9FJ_000262 [Alteromonadaceae bacterium]|jgi:hypothetical protein